MPQQAEEKTVSRNRRRRGPCTPCSSNRCRSGNGPSTSSALTALIVLSPVFAAAALAVRLTSPGPVVFAQWRDSKGSKPFKMYKFRTMVVDAERQQEERRR